MNNDPSTQSIALKNSRSLAILLFVMINQESQENPQAMIGKNIQDLDNPANLQKVLRQAPEEFTKLADNFRASIRIEGDENFENIIVMLNVWSDALANLQDLVEFWKKTTELPSNFQVTLDTAQIYLCSTIEHLTTFNGLTKTMIQNALAKQPPGLSDKIAIWLENIVEGKSQAA